MVRICYKIKLYCQDYCSPSPRQGPGSTRQGTRGTGKGTGYRSSLYLSSVYFRKMLTSRVYRRSTKALQRNRLSVAGLPRGKMRRRCARRRNLSGRHVTATRKGNSPICRSGSPSRAALAHAIPTSQPQPLLPVFPIRSFYMLCYGSLL